MQIWQCLGTLYIAGKFVYKKKKLVMGYGSNKGNGTNTTVYFRQSFKTLNKYTCSNNGIK